MDCFAGIAPINYTKRKIPMNSFSKTLLFLLCIIIFSCKTKLSDNTTNDWNSGKIVIATDENLKDIMAQLVEIYEHENDSAHIVLNYQPQEKIVNDFVNGKTKSMI